jgi:hypothetical protein
MGHVDGGQRHDVRDPALPASRGQPVLLAGPLVHGDGVLGHDLQRVVGGGNGDRDGDDRRGI